MKKLTKKELENKSLSARIKRRGKAGTGTDGDWIKTSPFGSYETDSHRVIDRETEKQRLNGMRITGRHKNCKYADKHQCLR